MRPTRTTPSRRRTRSRTGSSLRSIPFTAATTAPSLVIDPAGWRLRIGGLVDADLELSLADLHRFTPRTLTATLQCAGNRRAGLIRVRDIPGEDPWGPGAISTAEWTGVSLAEVLRAAGPRAGARHVAFSASDISPVADPPQPFGGSVPLPQGAGRRGAPGLGHERAAASPGARRTRPGRGPRLHRRAQHQVDRADHRAGAPVGELLPGHRVPAAARRRRPARRRARGRGFAGLPGGQR